MSFLWVRHRSIIVDQKMSQGTKDLLINRAITLFHEGKIKGCFEETLGAIKKYPDVWFDFRLVSKGFYDFGELKYINKYLTFYQQNIKGELWTRVIQAH